MGQAGTIKRSIRYDPLPSQRRFHEAASKFKGFSGPVGSGKSAALAQEAIRLSIVNSGLLGLIGAPTFPMLRDSAQRAIFEVLDDNQLPYRFHKTENIVELENGSEIMFRSLDNFERMRGPNIAWFGVDELTYCKREAWLRLEARMRHPLATERCGFGVWTPKGFDWVYERFIGSSALAGYKAILASPRENRYLPSDYYTDLRASYDERFAAQEVEGEYLNICSGRVYYAFDRAAHVKPLKYSHLGPVLCWSLDFNVSPMCSVICQIDDSTTREDMMMGRRSRTLQVLDEISLPDSHTTAACEEFERRVAPWIGTRGPVALRIYGDPAGNARQHAAGHSDYQIIREFFAKRRNEFQVTYHVGAAAPAVRDRVNAVNGKLKPAEGLIGMAIDPRCKSLIRDFEQVVWAADSNGNMSGQIDGRDKERTHLSSAVGYLIEMEFGIRTSGGPRSTYVA